MTKKSEKLLAAGFLLCLAFFFGNYAVQTAAFWNLSAEYRDGAVFAFVENIARGTLPYSLENLTQAQPTALLDSGITHLLPALVLRLAGLPTAGAVYLGNLLYLVGIAVLAWKITRQLLTRTGTLLSCACASAWIVSFMVRGTVLVTRPDTFCCMLLLWVIYLFTKPSLRGIDVVLAALACTVTAFAKIHYAVIILAVLLYFPLNRRELPALRYLGLFALTGILSTAGLFFLHQLLFPTYLSEWVPRILEMLLGNSSLSAASFQLLLGKCKAILLQTLPASVLAVAALGLLWAEHRRGESDPQRLFLLLNCLVNGLVLVYTGRHTGADLWYFYYMLVPSLILLMVKTVWELPVRSWMMRVLFVPVLLLCLWNNVRLIRPAMAYADSLHQAEAVADDYEGELYLSPMLSTYAISRNLYQYNPGDGDYLCPDSITDRIYHRLPILKPLLPYTKSLYAQHTAYGAQMVRKAENQEYSLVVLDNLEDVPAVMEGFREALIANYRIADIRTVSCLTCTVTLTYWVPLG